MIEWTKALSVGIDELDAQHQELFRRADRLVRSLSPGAREDVADLIRFLHEHARTHFAAEEAAMLERSFTGYVRHKAEHDRFVCDLLSLVAEHRKHGSSALVAVKASRWLAQWLEQHVGGTDAELGRFLKQPRTAA